MNIGFDLDGVFVGLPPFLPTWVIESLYRDKDHEKLHYRMPGKVEREIRKFSHNHFFRPPLEENISFLRTLSRNKKHKLFLISSRFGFLEKATKEILAMYGLHKIFQEVVFNYNNEQPHVFKNAVVNKLHIEYFIDDDIYLLRFLAKENKDIKFFWLNPRENLKIADNLFAITLLSKTELI